MLVVDDSAFVRQALARMLSGAPDIEVVGMAVDGQEGVEKARALRPDVVTLDIQMPRMGGLEALQRDHGAECPYAVLLLSSLTQEGADVTLRGLELGAMDFVDKSTRPGPHEPARASRRSCTRRCGPSPGAPPAPARGCTLGVCPPSPRRGRPGRRWW